MRQGRRISCDSTEPWGLVHPHIFSPEERSHTWGNFILELLGPWVYIYCGPSYIKSTKKSIQSQQCHRKMCKGCGLMVHGKWSTSSWKDLRVSFTYDKKSVLPKGLASPLGVGAESSGRPSGRRHSCLFYISACLFTAVFSCCSTFSNYSQYLFL